MVEDRAQGGVLGAGAVEVVEDAGYLDPGGGALAVGRALGGEESAAEGATGELAVAGSTVKAG